MATSINLGMARTAQQERFGDAFLLSVASVAGCSCAKPDTDNDSIDWTLSCKIKRRPKIDVQMKTTSHDGQFADVIHFPLIKKNYDDLILTDVCAPRILVVVTVPKEMDEWLTVSPQELVLRRSAYWVSLAGLPERENETKITVNIPTNQLFTVEQLTQMMQKISKEGVL